MKTVKRKRIQPDRFGETSANKNKDAYFDDDNDDDAHINMDSGSSREGQLEVSSGTSLSNDNTPAGNSQIAPQIQLARMEAKIDGLVKVIHKIQRMMVSLTINSTNVDASNVDHHFLSMLPLKTEESIDQLEKQLNDNAFRRVMVSVDLCDKHLYAS